MEQRAFETHADSFATSDASSGYKYPIVFPKGYVWCIDSFFVLAHTNYAAAATHYQTFTLADASANNIASVANGPSSGGLAIGPAVATGIDETMTAAYKYIDCTAEAKTCYVFTAATSNGLAMIGLKFVVMATPRRKAGASIS